METVREIEQKKEQPGFFARIKKKKTTILELKNKRIPHLSYIFHEPFPPSHALQICSLNPPMRKKFLGDEDAHLYSLSRPS